MTKVELEQYSRINADIRNMVKNLDELQNLINAPADGQRADAAGKYRELREIYENRLDEMLGAKLRLEKELAELPDPTVREIIGYKYMDGLTWTAVSTRVYGYPSEDRARKALNRCLEKYF